MPTLDGVVFVDPRRSQVDVVQAVGRAIRKAEDKKIGTILLPVALPPDAEADEELAASVFEPVVKVLRALRDHDAELAYELDELRVELGRLGTVARLPSKIKTIAPTNVGWDFIRAFQVRAVKLVTPGWDEAFGLLQRFVDREGDALVPVAHHEDGYHLDRGSTRSAPPTAGATSAASVSHVSMVFEGGRGTSVTTAGSKDSPPSSGTSTGKGTRASDIPTRTRTASGLATGWSLSEPPTAGANSAVIELRASQHFLAGLGDPFVDLWEQGFGALQRYVDREGHARVPGRLPRGWLPSRCMGRQTASGLSKCCPQRRTCRSARSSAGMDLGPALGPVGSRLRRPPAIRR